MVNQRRLFEGYILIFIAIFIFSIIYPMISTAVSSVFSMPQNEYTTAMNATMGIQSVSNSMGLMSLVIVCGIIVVFLTGFLGVSRGASAF